MLDTLTVGQVQFIPAERVIVFDHHNPIHLTNLELRLMFYLMIQAGAATFADTSAGMASLPVQRVMTAMGMYFFYATRLILHSQRKRIPDTPTDIATSS